MTGLLELIRVSLIFVRLIASADRKAVCMTVAVTRRAAAGPGSGAFSGCVNSSRITNPASTISSLHRMVMPYGSAGDKNV